ncbi:MAG: GNAT family N-acetyltransferase [Candidatus Lokiarchaeota archaeon]|nr:GNAT family N-acetyltransferase [Candidatus Lokiarchaeota archaeon]
MKSHESPFQCFVTKDISKAEQIFKIKEDLLVKPQNTRKATHDEKNEYSESGFVIGDHSIEEIKQWINSEMDQVYIVQKKNAEDSVLAYLIILNDKEIHEEVKEYSKEINFNEDQHKKVIDSNEYVYLIQIAVSPSHQRQGIGSLLLNTAYQDINKPIISFVMKNPILNKASLSLHLRQGFDYMGEYFGSFGEFKGYKSIGLIHYPNNKTRNKKDIINLMNKFNE